MRELPAPNPYHPRWYRRRVSTYWWLGKWSYLAFILRELSSVFVAWFVLLTLVELRALEHGPGAYDAFHRWLRSPLAVALNVISLCFVLFHVITWLNLAPRAMPLRMGGKRIPDRLIAGANYAAWIVVSLILGAFMVRW